MCYAQRSKTLNERKKQPQRVVALEKQPQREVSCKWTAYRFSNLLTKNTCNLGVIKNNGKAHLFLLQLLEWHLELHFIFSERHLYFLSMQYLLQWQLTNPCLLPDIIAADRRDTRTWAHIMCLDEVSNCEFLGAQHIKPRRVDINDGC